MLVLYVHHQVMSVKYSSQSTGSIQRQIKYYSINFLLIRYIVALKPPLLSLISYTVYNFFCPMYCFSLVCHLFRFILLWSNCFIRDVIKAAWPAWNLSTKYKFHQQSLQIPPQHDLTPREPSHASDRLLISHPLLAQPSLFLPSILSLNNKGHI